MRLTSLPLTPPIERPMHALLLTASYVSYVATASAGDTAHFLRVVPSGLPSRMLTSPLPPPSAIMDEVLGRLTAVQGEVGPGEEQYDGLQVDEARAVLEERARIVMQQGTAAGHGADKVSRLA